jgi:hypothetical protein
MRDWKTEIVKGVLIQQRIEELDRGRLWERHLPEVAASEAAIAQVEGWLGFTIDAQYREFLRFANGWRAFYQRVDLFGTENLLGAPPMDAAARQLEAIDPVDLLAITGMAHGDLLPIAASSVQRDIFLLGQPLSPSPGAVIWFSGGEVQRFPTFDEYFLSMLDYNRQEVAYLERAGNGR